ncbi:MAG: HEPN domain-containing protein [Phycisphaerales bacterium]|nr:HEPN domain-containing protein [Phycisphaerales bacterium]
MMETGRYVYVLFCCQQAVEKWLKGRIAEATGELPPRLHNLLSLAEHALLHLDESNRGFLRELSAYYIQSRYPGDFDLPAGIDHALAIDILRRTEEFLKWSSSTT